MPSMLFQSVVMALTAALALAGGTQVQVPGSQRSAVEAPVADASLETLAVRLVDAEGLPQGDIEVGLHLRSSRSSQHVQARTDRSTGVAQLTYRPRDPGHGADIPLPWIRNLLRVDAYVDGGLMRAIELPRAESTPLEIVLPPLGSVRYRVLGIEPHALRFSAECIGAPTREFIELVAKEPFALRWERPLLSNASRWKLPPDARYAGLYWYAGARKLDAVQGVVQFDHVAVGTTLALQLVDEDMPVALVTLVPGPTTAGAISEVDVHFEDHLVQFSGELRAGDGRRLTREDVESGDLNFECGAQALADGEDGLRLEPRWDEETQRFSLRVAGYFLKGGQAVLRVRRRAFGEQWGRATTVPLRAGPEASEVDLGVLTIADPRVLARGFVVDEDEVGLADVAVTPWTHPAHPGSDCVLDPQDLAKPRPYPIWKSNVRTDADGAFAVQTEDCCERLWLRITGHGEHGGALAVPVEPGTQDLRIVLPRSGQLAFRLRGPARLVNAVRLELIPIESELGANVPGSIPQRRGGSPWSIDIDGDFDSDQIVSRPADGALADLVRAAGSMTQDEREALSRQHENREFEVNVRLRHGLPPGLYDLRLWSEGVAGCATVPGIRILPGEDCDDARLFPFVLPAASHTTRVEARGTDGKRKEVHVWALPAMADGESVWCGPERSDWGPQGPRPPSIRSFEPPRALAVWSPGHRLAIVDHPAVDVALTLEPAIAVSLDASALPIGRTSGRRWVVVLRLASTSKSDPLARSFTAHAGEVIDTVGPDGLDEPTSRWDFNLPAAGTWNVEVLEPSTSDIHPSAPTNLFHALPIEVADSAGPQTFPIELPPAELRRLLELPPR